MKIGNVELENNIFLAPMAGITDLPFRLICKEFGAGLVYTEMISCKGLMYNDSKTELLLKTEKEEKPLAVQIFGSDLKAIEYAVKYLDKYADIIDINMGCPAPKVTKNGDGSKLLLNLELVEKIVKTAVNNCTRPITVKMRIGWDKDNIVAVDAAKRIASAGASAITIHGRTRSEFYSGVSDWNIIKTIKETVHIPVIGNGDITSAEDARKRMEESGVDAIMIGRASIGNPWIFKDCINLLKYENKVKKPELTEKLKVILKHIELACKYKSESTAIKEMRKHIACYTKGLKDSSNFRNKINQLQTKKQVEEALKQYFNELY